MSKFNETTKGSNITTNNCGHKAYKMEDKLKLTTMVLTTMFGESKFYGDNTNELVKLAKDLISNKEGEFIANLAVFTRKEMHLRSVSHALCSILAGEINGKEFVKYAVNGVVERADDITEILSCYISMYGKPIANSLKKALASSMNKFNEYQFGKYNRDSKQVKFKDVLKITHAKAKNETQNKIFKDILQDTLATPYTWEVELSAKGNNKETWEQLIASDKVGIMALIRNLNNIVKNQPENLEKVYDTLRNENVILKSKLLPFRFYSAYKKLEENNLASSKIFDSLEIALKYSTQNIEKLSGKTLIAIDVSGSMNDVISRKSDIKCSDIACLLGAMANSICEDSIVVTFDTDLYKQNLSTMSGIISNAKKMNSDGGGTDITLPLKYLLTHKINVDRIIILSDNEINSNFSNDHWSNKTCQQFVELYKKEVNSNVWVHAVDLQGYGTQQFMGKNVNIVAGWNEKIFDFIHLAEQGFDKIVKVIENYNEVSENVDINAES